MITDMMPVIDEIGSDSDLELSDDELNDSDIFPDNDEKQSYKTGDLLNSVKKRGLSHNPNKIEIRELFYQRDQMQSEIVKLQGKILDADKKFKEAESKRQAVEKLLDEKRPENTKSLNWIDFFKNLKLLYTSARRRASREAFNFWPPKNDTLEWP